MLSHCCAPTSFCMSTMIPILKGSGSIGDMKTIVALPSVACLSCLTHVLYLVNLIVCYPIICNYKWQTSTIQCVSSVLEAVSCYIGHLGHTYMCTLDASKAFDPVNLLLLFSKLLQRDMCPLFLRFLMSTYCNQQIRVKWNGTTSNTFLLPMV